MISVALPGAEVRFTERADGDVKRDGLPSLGRVLRLGRQVHGIDVATDDDPREEADAQVTTRDDLAVGVLVADCVPVAIASDEGVAVAHAGWRGLAAGVLEATLERLPGTPIAAAIGPSAGPCCYEVGDEVRAAFGIETAHADLPALASARLRAAGIDEIHVVGACTICDERFFSFRREGETAGRQAGIAWRS